MIIAIKSSHIGVCGVGGTTVGLNRREFIANGQKSSVGEVQIIINSNGSSQEIAGEVYKVLRDLGRYARSPSVEVR